MPNDAKLGLVVGVGVVIAIGVVFFRKDPQPQATANVPPIVAPSPAANKSAPPTSRSEPKNAPVEALEAAAVGAGDTAEKH